MKKYKLIKTYPNSPELGTIIDLNKINCDVITSWYISPNELLKWTVTKHAILNNPEFWQEIVEYPIGTKVKDKETGFIYTKEKSGIWNYILDESEIGKNKRFEIIEEKKPLFISEDGIEIFEGDKLYWIKKEALIMGEYEWMDNEYVLKEYFKTPDFNNYVWFSSKDRAQEYIILNKPCLSINDFKKAHFVVNEIELKKVVRNRLKQLEN